MKVPLAKSGRVPWTMLAPREMPQRNCSAGLYDGPLSVTDKTGSEIV